MDPGRRDHSDCHRGLVDIQPSTALEDDVHGGSSYRDPGASRARCCLACSGQQCGVPEAPASYSARTHAYQAQATSSGSRHAQHTPFSSGVGGQ